MQLQQQQSAQQRKKAVCLHTVWSELSRFHRQSSNQAHAPVWSVRTAAHWRERLRHEPSVSGRAPLPPRRSNRLSSITKDNWRRVSPLSSLSFQRKRGSSYANIALPRSGLINSPPTCGYLTGRSQAFGKATRNESRH